MKATKVKQILKAVFGGKFLVMRDRSQPLRSFYEKKNI